jgi:hypothetical protein
MKIFLMKDIVLVANFELLVENSFEQEINS